MSGEDGNTGGSGGSIYIDTPYLSGSGQVKANGGSGNGGGGRIAVVQTNAFDFSGDLLVEGSGTGAFGESTTTFEYING